MTRVTPGDRVQLHPGLDDWMRGDRFGIVVKIGRLYVHVKLDRSGRTRRYSVVDLSPVLKSWPDAHAAARKAMRESGHIPLNCDRSYECPRCGASGVIADFDGDLVLVGGVAEDCKS